MSKQITFGYPRRGLEGRFNTIRLGASWATKVVPGDEVELVDSRSLKVLGRAIVESVSTGPLDEVANAHAHMAHNWKAHPAEERPALLKASLSRRYPPGRVRSDSICSVIYLRALVRESGPTLKT